MENQLTSEEIDFCMYKLNMAGDFKTSLYKTYWLGDTSNRMKLTNAFPFLKIADRYANEENYWQDLIEKWNTHNVNHKLYG